MGTVKEFAKFADMVAATSLAVGDLALTKCYDNITNGGGGQYIIVAPTGFSADDFTIVDIPNSGSGLIAVLQHDGEIDFSFFGALTGTGSVPNETATTTAFEKAVEICSANCYTLVIPAGNYYIKDGITFSDTSSAPSEDGGERLVKVVNKISIRGQYSSKTTSPKNPTSRLIFKSLKKGVNAIQVGDSTQSSDLNAVIEDLTIQYQGTIADLHENENASERVIDYIEDADRVNGVVLTGRAKRDSFLNRLTCFGFKYGAGILISKVGSVPGDPQEVRLTNCWALKNYIGINCVAVNMATLVGCTSAYNALYNIRLGGGVNTFSFTGGLIEGVNANDANNGNLSPSPYPEDTNKTLAAQIYLSPGASSVSFFGTFMEWGGGSAAANNGQIRFLAFEPSGTTAVAVVFNSCFLNGLNGGADDIAPIYIIPPNGVDPENVKVYSKFSFIDSKFTKGVGETDTSTPLAQIGPPVGSPPVALRGNEIITGPAQFGYTALDPGNLTINRDLNSRSLKIEGDNQRLITSRAQVGQDSPEEVVFSEIQGFRNLGAGSPPVPVDSGEIKFLTKNLLDPNALERFRVDREGNIVPLEDDSIDIGATGLPPEDGDVERRIRRIYAKRIFLDDARISKFVEIESNVGEPGSVIDEDHPAGRIFKKDGNNGLFFKTKDGNASFPRPDLVLELTAPTIDPDSTSILKVTNERKLEFTATATNGVVLDTSGVDAEFKLGGDVVEQTNIKVLGDQGGVIPSLVFQDRLNRPMANFQDSGWALGQNATIPSGTNDGGQSAVVIGKGAQAPEINSGVTANNGIAIGTNAGKSPDGGLPSSISIGVNANNDNEYGLSKVGQSSIALGHNTATQEARSVAIGTNLRNKKAETVLIGTGVDVNNKMTSYLSNDPVPVTIGNSVGIGFGVTQPSILLAQDNRSFINNSHGLVIGDEPQTGREKVILDLASNDKAMILPTLNNTAESALTDNSVTPAIPPVEGMMIYNTSIKKLRFYNGTSWETVTSS